MSLLVSLVVICILKAFDVNIYFYGIQKFTIEFD